MSYEQVRGLRYEESKYPPRFLRRSNYFLTIHHASAESQGSYQILRLSRDTARVVLAALERDTGLIDRRSTKASFLGLPVHVAVGDAIYLTDATGRTKKGRITHLSASSIEMEPAYQFDAEVVRRIELSDPVWDGALFGALFGWGGALYARGPCLTGGIACGPADHPNLMLAAGAIVGWGIDTLVRRRAYSARSEAMG